MIRRLRLRMSLLVIGVLILVSAGIVLAIYEVNNRNIVSQVESALEVLANNSGVRPSLPEMDPGAGRTGAPGSGARENPTSENTDRTPPPKPGEENSSSADSEASDNTSSSESAEGIQDRNSPPSKPAEENGDIPADDTSLSESTEGTSNRSTPPPKPEGEEDSSDKGAPPARPEGSSETDRGAPPEEPASSGDRGPSGAGGTPPGSPPSGRSRSMSGEEVASLSNYYTITLDEEGQIESWTSDRSDLYNEESLQDFAGWVLASGQESGQMGTQFFRLIDQEDETRLLIVLDARLEMQAGQQVLQTTILVAGIACLLLSLGAWLLIRRMVRPVEEAFTKQQQFVWDASHELKTPLAVISANADLLEGDIGDNEYLSYIRSEVRRTDSLVKNLLTLARMDRGTANQEMTDLDLSEAVLGVLLPFESTVFEAGKILESEIQEQVHVTGNEAMLQQLTVILLSNALKYSDAHGSIRVTLEKKGRGAELRVENTGDGIAPKDLDRIFDRFYRTDSSRNSETGGEGLGLAIASSIVEIHHGKIRAESVPGKNAVFIVSLP